jgi:hypothetical protein
VPNGWLYKVAGKPNVDIVDQSSLRPIPTHAVFLAMGLKQRDIHVVSRWPNLPQGTPLTTPALIPVNGTLWHPANGPAVFVAQNGVFRQIPSAALFRELGYSVRSEHFVPSLTNLPVEASIGATAIPAGNPPPTTGSPAPSPAVNFVPTPDARGYWILDQNGTVAAYGDAPALPQPSAAQMGASTAVSLAVTPDESGADIILADG